MAKADFTNIPLSFSEQLGGFFFKWRDYTPLPLVVISLVCAQPSLISLGLGTLVALCGELYRAYGVAYIGTVSRTRSHSNGDLVDTGPFAITRNPLYCGNFLIYTGLALAAGVWWLPILVAVMFCIQYVPIVLWEEKKLKVLFGNAYERYQTRVPARWIPSLGNVLSKKGWQKPSPSAWSHALRSEKRTSTAFSLFLTPLWGLYFWRPFA